MLQKSWKLFRVYCSTHLFYFIAHETIPVQCKRLISSNRSRNGVARLLGLLVSCIERSKWLASDPQILAEILFSIANVLSFARTTYVMPSHELLGPLQVSFGRMLTDIGRFVVLFLLVCITLVLLIWQNIDDVTVFSGTLQLHCKAAIVTRCLSSVVSLVCLQRECIVTKQLQIRPRGFLCKAAEGLNC